MTPSPVSIWLQASRPKTLPAAISPVIVGTAMAYDAGLGHAASALAALFGAVMIQIGTNFANDYFDYTKGTDTTDRLGPQRVTSAGLVSPVTIKRAIAIAFTLAFVAGIYLVTRGGWPIVVIGLLSILFGILYTAGPYPLGYNGLGEVFVLIFFGPVAVGGTYYVQALTVPAHVLIAGFMPGLLSTAILTVNNLRDIDQDYHAAKKTLPVRFGRTFARSLYLSCIIVSAGIVVFLTMTVSSHTWSLIALGASPIAVPAIRTVFTKLDGPSLNNALAKTGLFLLVFSLLFSLGWLV